MTFYLILEIFSLQDVCEKHNSNYVQFKVLTDALTNSILVVFDDCEPHFAVVAHLDHFHGVADHM